MIFLLKRTYTLLLLPFDFYSSQISVLFDATYIRGYLRDEETDKDILREDRVRMKVKYVGGAEFWRIRGFMNRCEAYFAGVN